VKMIGRFAVTIFFSLLFSVVVWESVACGDLLNAPIRGADDLVSQGRRITPDGQIDPAATILGNRFGGQASVRLEGFGNREFDFISGRFVGQTFGGKNIANNAKNFLSKSRRTQIRETLRDAQETGRQPLFNFEGVTPQADILSFINRNAQRVGVTPKITNIVPVPR